MIRKILIACGLALLIVGGYMTWRAFNPPLTDQQQVEANLQKVARAIEKQQPRRLLEYLAPEFQWRDLTRDYISENSGALGGMGLSWTDVELRLSGVQTQVTGQNAVTSGNFTLFYRYRNSGYRRTHVGKFKAFWEKRDGEWLVVKVEGGENFQP